AVPGSTAGIGALAAKVLAITVVGGAAVGVTAKEVADVQSFGQSKQARMRAAAAVIARHSAAQAPPSSAAPAAAWSPIHVTVGRSELRHANHHATPPLAPTPTTPGGATNIVQVPGYFDPTSESPSASVAPTPASTDQPDSAQAEPASQAPVSDAADGAAPTSSSGSPVPDNTASSVAAAD